MRLPQIYSAHFEPLGGTHIEDARREAVALAIEHSCDVTFKHNGRMYRVLYHHLIDCVKEAVSYEKATP